MRQTVNRAFFVMVAVDEDQKPVQVPDLVISTEAEKAGMRLQKCAVPCENSEERMDSDVRCRNFLHSLKKLKIV